MKNIISILTSLILITSLQSFSQQQGHLMNNDELEEAYEKATSNSDVIAYTRILESQGYTHESENSIGIVRDSDGAFFINLAFNKNDNQLTSHIIYRKWPNGVEKVTFWEGKINEDGTITTTSEFLITEGQRAADVNEMTEITKPLGCFVAWCGGSLVGCLFSNCGYLHCVAIGCTVALVGCVLQWLFGG